MQHEFSRIVRKIVDAGYHVTNPGAILSRIVNTHDFTAPETFEADCLKAFHDGLLTEKE